jgi:hypothetical protein
MALGALLVLLPILLCGMVVDRALDQFRDRIRAESLTELVDAKANAVQAWLAREKMVTQSWADSMKVRQLISELRITSDNDAVCSPASGASRVAAARSPERRDESHRWRRGSLCRLGQATDHARRLVSRSSRRWTGRDAQGC